MSIDRGILLQRLAEFEDVAGRPSRYVVALSGGLDSSVLTHMLATGAAEHGVPVVGVYIDHGLHADSTRWGEHCADFAAALGIDFRSRRVTVDLESGQGVEAAAREARYAELNDLLEPGDWLLSAHHGDDQAETVLLHLMRGSGAAGLAGIPALRRLGAGWLVRPLLDVPRSELETYASRHAVDSITDPANAGLQYDRNYLRHEILPRLEARWPDAAVRIGRSARLARETAKLLAELAEIDRAEFADRPDRLPIAALAAMPVERQRNLLRYVILERGLPMPGAAQLESIIRDLVPARDDARPLVAWFGGRARRYRGRLYLMPADDFPDPAPAKIAPDCDRIRLPGSLGELVFDRSAQSGLSQAVLSGGLELRFRVGGEKFKPENQRHTKKLKKLLQEAGIVPWMRERLPLLYAGDELVAVADLWLAAGAVSTPGTAINWRHRPPLH